MNRRNFFKRVGGITAMAAASPAWALVPSGRAVTSSDMGLSRSVAKSSHRERTPYSEDDGLFILVIGVGSAGRRAVAAALSAGLQGARFAVMDARSPHMPDICDYGPESEIICELLENTNFVEYDSRGGSPRPIRIDSKSLENIRLYLLVGDAGEVLGRVPMIDEIPVDSGWKCVGAVTTSPLVPTVDEYIQIADLCAAAHFLVNLPEQQLLSPSGTPIRSKRDSDGVRLAAIEQIVTSLDGPTLFNYFDLSFCRDLFAECRRTYYVTGTGWGADRAKTAMESAVASLPDGEQTLATAKSAFARVIAKDVEIEDITATNEDLLDRMYNPDGWEICVGLFDRSLNENQTIVSLLVGTNSE